MKYYFQFEGNEKIAITIILIGIAVIIILLSIIAFTERPIYTNFDELYLLELLKKNMHCPVCHGGY
jgi:hypothetical protein